MAQNLVLRFRNNIQKRRTLLEKAIYLDSDNKLKDFLNLLNNPNLSEEFVLKILMLLTDEYFSIEELSEPGINIDNLISILYDDASISLKSDFLRDHIVSVYSGDSKHVSYRKVTETDDNLTSEITRIYDGVFSSTAEKTEFENFIKKVYPGYSVKRNTFVRVNDRFSEIETKYIGLFSYLLNYTKGLYSSEQQNMNSIQKIGYLKIFDSNVFSSSDALSDSKLSKYSSIVKDLLENISKRTINY